MSAAVGVLARQHAVKQQRQLQARGLKLQSMSHREIIALADKYLADVSRRLNESALSLQVHARRGDSITTGIEDRDPIAVIAWYP